MRTWSVSGTAFALWTRSSSLSIKTSTSMGFRSLQRAPVRRPEGPESAPFGLRLWLRLGLGAVKGLPRLGGPENPTPPARPELLEELLRLGTGKHDLVLVREPGLEPVCGLADRAARPQLLEHLVYLALAEPDVMARAEHRL